MRMHPTPHFSGQAYSQYAILLQASLACNAAPATAKSTNETYQVRTSPGVLQYDGGQPLCPSLRSNGGLHIVFTHVSLALALEECT